MALRLWWRFWPPLQWEKEVRPLGSGHSSGLAPAFVLRKAVDTKLTVEMEVRCPGMGRRYVNWPRSIKDASVTSLPALQQHLYGAVYECRFLSLLSWLVATCLSRKRI